MDSDVDSVPGEFPRQRVLIEAYTVPDDSDLAQHPRGVKEWALDPAIAKRLWTVSTDLLRA